MKKIIKRGFTLTELLIVVVFIGVVISISVVNFRKTRERAYDKEAIANLYLIQHAEKLYNMSFGAFYPQVGTSNFQDINDNLGLNLNNRTWEYNISVAGGVFTVVSDRTLNRESRTWTINSTMTEPVCSPGNRECP